MSEKAVEGRQHTVIELWHDFGNNTTMHGLRRAVSGASPWKRGIWSLMILGSFFWAVFQLQDIIRDYYRYPVTTVVELKHDGKMRFPAVTICNLNPISTAAVPFNEMYKKEEMALISDQDIGFIKTTIVKAIPKKERNLVSHSISDIMLTCTFNKKPCSTNDFVEFANAEYGLCYTFDPKNANLMYTTKAGPRSGLILEIDIEQRHYLELSAKAGIKVVIHDHDEYPFPEDGGILAEPGVVTSIALSQTVTRRLPAPYGTCISHKDSMSRKLTMFPSDKYRYTENACRKSCYQSELILNCGCCDSLLPCDNKTFFEIANVTTVDNDIRVCSFEDTECTYEIGQRFINGSIRCSKNCPFECDRTVYNSIVSAASWPSDANLELFVLKSNKTIFENKTSGSNDELKKFIQANFLRLEIFYETLDFNEITTKPAYDWGMVLSDVGGQLGLWLGFSLLTAMELIELFVDAVRMWLRKLYKKEIYI